MAAKCVIVWLVNFVDCHKRVFPLEMSQPRLQMPACYIGNSKLVLELVADKPTF